MQNLTVKSHPEVTAVFQKYPASIKKKMEKLRDLIFETAEEAEDISTMEETLKWGEPSYITRHGSTLRVDWKEKTPQQYAMYFNCSSRLVETFKVLYKDVFAFEKNRAIVFQLEDSLPISELKACIGAALRYHKVKHLPTLGI